MNKNTIAASLLIALMPCTVGNALAKDAAPSGEDADTRAMVQEERDRLAREKREMLEREALLRKQLQTHDKLLKEQEAQLEDLKRQLRELKRGD
ncbi:MAG: hypothetical protein ACLGHG_04835 [Gammaproteobacteria bacterium]